VTNFLTSESYGELALLTSIQAFCGLFLVNPIGQYINLNTHRWHDEDTLFIRIKAYRWYLFLVSAIGAFVVIVSMFSVSDNIFLSVISLFLIVLTVNWNSTLVPLLNMLGSRQSSIVWSLVTVIIGIVFSTVFVILSPTASSWLFGQALGMAIGGFGAWVSLKKFNSVKAYSHEISLIDRKTIVTYCLPLAIATGFMWLFQSGYRFAIEHFWGLASLAFFTIGLQVASAMWTIIETIAMQFLNPYFFRSVTDVTDEGQLKKYFSDLINVLAPIYIVLTGFLIISAPYLMALLVDEKYQTAVEFVILGAVIELCRVIVNIFANAAHVKRNTKTLTAPYALAALIAISAIVMVGLLEHPMIQAAYSLVFASVVLLCMMAVMMYRQINYRLDIKRWLFAIMLLILLIMLKEYMPIDTSIIASIKTLGLLTILALFVLFVFLMNSAALARLTAHNLVAKK
jgi:O-antigen/teichoic acid export membrane protein